MDIIAERMLPVCYVELHSVKQAFSNIAPVFLQELPLRCIQTGQNTTDLSTDWELTSQPTPSPCSADGISPTDVSRLNPTFPLVGC